MWKATSICSTVFWCTMKSVVVILLVVASMAAHANNCTAKYPKSIEVRSSCQGKNTYQLLKPEFSTISMFQVRCDYSVDGQGWIVIHRRFDGSLSFYRNWTDYRDGFGSIEREFWLGLEKIHQITRSGNYELLVVLKDFVGFVKTALYSNFTISSEYDKYRLTYDGFLGGSAGDSLAPSNGMMFSTPDSDNDINQVVPSCADYYRSGWWFRDCHDA